MKPLKYVLVQAAIFSSLLAMADTKIRQVADWSLWESSDGKTCYIVTDNYNYNSDDPFNNEATVTFGFFKAKNNPGMPIELLLKYKTNKNKNMGALATLSGVSSIGLSDLEGRRKTYFGVGKSISAFLERASTSRGMITIKPVGGRAEEVDLSTSGVKDIVGEMQRRCNGGKSLVNVEFEAQFFSQMPITIDPTRLDPAKTQSLRALYFAAYKAFDNIQNANIELEKILAKYKPLLDELERNNKRIEQINLIELPKNQNILTVALKQQADARAEIARIEALIPALEAQVDRSQKAFDQARAILAPYEPEYNRITSALSSAQSQLYQAERRLAYIDERTDQLRRHIYNLEIEERELERVLPQKKLEMDRAYDRYREAQYQRSNFHPRREVEKALSRHIDYQRLLREKQQSEASLRQVEGDLARLQNEKSRVVAELQACKSETPSKDCSAQEAALSSIDQVINLKQNERREVADRISSVRSSLSTIENQIEIEVRREFDRLERYEDQARRAYEARLSEVNRDQDRLSQIKRQELPSLQNELSQLTFERPSVVSRINQAASEVARFTDELARFKAATDWDRKYDNVVRAESQLRQDQSNLARTQRDLQKQKDLLAQGITIEAQARAEIDSLNRQLLELAARNVELDRGLSKLPEERAEFDRKIEQEQALFNDHKLRFAALL